MMDSILNLEECDQQEQVYDIHNIPQQRGRFELLILSEAGKPIYSFTRREDAVTLMPLCSALLNYARKTQKETLQSIQTSDNLVIDFSLRSPLIIIVIHEVNSYVDSKMLIEQAEAQVVSIITAKTLKSLFSDRPTFDMKRLLYGSEKLIDATINLSAFPNKLRKPWLQAFLALNPSSTIPTASVGQQPALANITSSAAGQHPGLTPRPFRVLVPVVIMQPSAREAINGMISSAVASNSKNIIFSLLFQAVTEEADETSESEQDDNKSRSEISIGTQETSASNGQHLSSTMFHLITVCNHHDRYKLKTADIHIILALLTGSKLQLASVESLWMPVCLPKFNQDAFLHSYISYINGMKNCLVQMSIDRDDFTNCQQSRNIIEEKFEAMLNDTSFKNKLRYKTSPLIHPVILEMHEKLTNESLTSEDIAQVQQQTKLPKQELQHIKQLQFLWYQANRQVLWWQRSARKSLHPTMYYITRKMLQSSLKHLWVKLENDTIFLGWQLPTFRLYAQFDCTITTLEATEVVQRITSWIKKEEDNFNIKDYR